MRLPDNVLFMTIRRVFAGRNRAYVYVLCSKENNVLYVGQTNDPGGVCGRLAGHIRTSGTLRKRMDDTEVFLDQVEDLLVFAFALPLQAEFTSRDETYREGVEYNVQAYLQQVRADWKPYFSLISKITAPVTTTYPEVVAVSQWIVEELNTLYHSSTS